MKFKERRHVNPAGDRVGMKGGRDGFY